MKTKTIIFDLDDTLINEIEYLKSAFLEIANDVDDENKNLYQTMISWYQNKENVFQNLIKIYPKTSIENLKNSYRNHYPNFNSNSKNRELLIELKQNGYKLGLITDGFSITQCNKIKSLGIENLFDLIIISEEFGTEKPNENNFKVFHQFQTDDYYYIGDNTKKDFITPNKLGWTSICLLDNGENIHKQNFDLELIYLPQIKVDNLEDIKKHIQ